MLSDIRKGSTGNIHRYEHKFIDFFHDLRILETIPGHIYLETTSVDYIEGVTTKELFFVQKKTSPTMTLISRSRGGRGHNTMKSYTRDSELPIGSRVRLQ